MYQSNTDNQEDWKLGFAAQRKENIKHQTAFRSLIFKMRDRSSRCLGAISVWANTAVLIATFLLQLLFSATDQKIASGCGQGALINHLPHFGILSNNFLQWGVLGAAGILLLIDYGLL